MRDLSPGATFFQGPSNALRAAETAISTSEEGRSQDWDWTEKSKGVHGRVTFLGSLVDTADGLLGGGVDGLKGLAIYTLDELVVDETG